MVSPQNDYYGHRRILNRYMKVPAGTRFAGLVQHGWEIEPWRPITTGSPFLRFGWGDRSRGAQQTRRLRLIGAPFLYHERARRAPFDAPRGALLVMPYHGFGVDLDGAHVRYADFVEQWRDDIDRVTVCLHPAEFDSPVREIYRCHGFEVVTNGVRDDPAFLDRLIGLFETHGTVTSNRLSTGVLYAAAVGSRTIVRGPFPRSADRIQDSVPYAQQVDAYRTVLPELVEGVEGTDACAIGARELGAEHRLTPDALADALGARWPWQAAVRSLSAVNLVRKRVLRRSFTPPPAAFEPSTTPVELVEFGEFGDGVVG